jgi:Uma2 family endonuclease
MTISLLPRFAMSRYAMSTAPRYLPRYTVAEYQAWQGDWELWDGIAVSMSPSPFGPHQRVAGRFYAALQMAIENAQCPATALYEIDWIISNHTVVRPDIVVLCGDAPERHLEQAPVVVAEILSPSTADRDRHHKRALYQAEKVHDYFILDPSLRTLSWFQLDNHGDYQRQNVGDQIVLNICENCQLKVVTANLFS